MISYEAVGDLYLSSEKRSYVYYGQTNLYNLDCFRVPVPVNIILINIAGLYFLYMVLCFKVYYFYTYYLFREFNHLTTK